MVNQKLKLRMAHRAKIIRGQLDGLVKAIEKEVYCPRLLEESRSIQRSLKSLDELMLENHLNTCIKHQMHDGQEAKAIKELMQIYNLAKK